MYPDSVDYADNNQYDYVGAPQSDALDRNAWSVAHQPQLNVNAAIKALNYSNYKLLVLLRSFENY